MFRAASRLLALTTIATATAACGGASAKRPPPAPATTCAATAAQVQRLGRGDPARVARVAAAFADRCTLDGWAADVRACIVTTESADKPKRCKERLSSLQRAALDLAIAEALDAAPKGPCEEYFAMQRQVEQCAGMPKRERDAYVESIQSMRSQYADSGDPEYRSSLETSCRYSIEMLTTELGRRCG